MTRSPLNEIFKCKNKKSKDKAIYKSHFQYGYTLKEIVEYIGVHCTTVSRTIKKSRGNMKSDIASPDPIILLFKGGKHGYQ